MAERGVLCSVRCTPLIFSYHVRQDEETLESNKQTKNTHTLMLSSLHLKLIGHQFYSCIQYFTLCGKQRLLRATWLGGGESADKE